MFTNIYIYIYILDTLSLYIYIFITAYIYMHEGREYSPICSVHRQKKVNDTMHWFASDKSWHLYHDASFLTYLYRPIITCGCNTLLLFRKL